MPFPASRLGDLTATGDSIVSPGMPTVLIAGQPASCLGDVVTGPVCACAVTQGSTVIVGGRPLTLRP